MLSCQSARTADIQVVSINKIIDQKVTDHKMCLSFTLTREDVVRYFTYAKEVDGTEFHEQAMILPCKYTGTLNMKTRLLQWEIIAGGAGYLFDKTVNKRYLCKETCCQKFNGLC